jgi:hypothetical protein
MGPPPAGKAWLSQMGSARNKEGCRKVKFKNTLHPCKFCNEFSLSISLYFFQINFKCKDWDRDNNEI